MLWAFDQECGNSGMKLVLLTLGNYADETGVCWPSQATLARKTSMTDRSVRENLSRLESGGFIACRSRTTGKGHYTSNIYQLLGEAQRKILPMDAASTGRNFRPPPEESSSGPAEDSSYNPKEEFNPQGKPQKESNPEKCSLVAAAAAATSSTETCAEYVKAVLELFVQASGRPPRLPSASDRELALTLFGEGVPLRVIEAAILQITGRNLGAEVAGQSPVKIRTLAYFLGAIREQQQLPCPDLFMEYLRYRVRELKKELAGPRQRTLVPEEKKPAGT